MKQLYLFLVMLLFPAALIAQIEITDADMPAENEGYNLSNTFLLSFDADDTGEDHEWDFSDLQMISQDSVFFGDVSDTPFIYQFVFNNFFDPDNQATETQIIEFLDLIPGIELDDIYLFTKTESDIKEELGYGVGFNGVPLPIQYDNKKTIYEFPMNYGDSTGDDYAFSISVPGLGYLGESGNRSYEVDGWGNITTPFGSFEALRLRIENVYEDSIYIDSSDFGFSIPREIVYYEWIAEDEGLPVLTITTELGIVTSVRYLDEYINTSVDEMKVQAVEFTLFPQPASDFVTLAFGRTPETSIEVSIFDLSGKRVAADNFQAKREVRVATDQLNPGIYMLEVKLAGSSSVEKLIIR